MDDDTLKVATFLLNTTVQLQETLRCLDESLAIMQRMAGDLEGLKSRVRELEADQPAIRRDLNTALSGGPVYG